ncbi:MAG: 3D-(3,5/4)-trihydroxycyclohexane-1,2-dione acylhydrolase (decyclizing) [Chloroflexi bacterium 13_1_40CM_3_70_6]|nr:MAG: 3D-(3,5/4)-trihydroxycyclohexane-1,2-dione acylhydrolase (decyclizing) [Chloroflexi bacterium 13_1_40CM_3_70_6]
MAQALVRFLSSQYVERDGVEQRFFAGCWGIFGHGNVAGIGQALFERPDLLPYHQARNEQSMLHTACGYARMRDRLATFACTSSIGPGATNMLTGAALATVNRLPVLLLPGDVFASRIPDPVLQQLEVPWRGDVSVNDAFQPVSRYWDRITRPEQLIPAALAALRVLTSPAETGAVTLALPQDVQVEAYEYPEEFLAKRVWHVERRRPDPAALARAVAAIRAARRPLIVAGGGVIYACATEALRRFVDETGIPVAETQAGKGALPYDHPAALGAIGATGNFAANRIARDADLVIGIGTRWSDFTTASKSLFAHPDVRFVNVNVAEVDAAKHGAVMMLADARAALEALAGLGHRVEGAHRDECARLARAWDEEVSRLYSLNHQPLPAQSEVIGAVNSFSSPTDVVVCAAGSMPGELHKLWRTRDRKQYHVEYGYSCMGYEIAGALGVKMSDPAREVYSLVGDGSYLMLSEAIVTSLQERVKLVVVLVDNHGYSSIGALSRSLGTEGFGTLFGYRRGGSLDTDRRREPAARPTEYLPTDLAANAQSLGAHVIRAPGIAGLRDALAAAKKVERTVVIYVEVDRYELAPAYESWWDVPVAETSETAGVRQARKTYEQEKPKQRRYL